MTDCAGCSRRLEPVSFKLLDASVGPDQLPQLGPGTEWSSEAVHWQSPAPDTDNWQYCEPVAAPALKVGPEYWARPLVSDKFSVAWPQSLSDNWPTHTDTLYRDHREIFSLITQIVTRSCDPDIVWSQTGLWFPSSSSVRETESGAKFAASHKMLFFSEKSLYSEVDQSFNVDTENYLVSEQAFTGTAG